jgi:hypothetical protein
MGVASYKVVPQQGSWHIEHDGEMRGSYATKESAFEAAAIAASNAIKQGHEVSIHVPGSSGAAPALGAS